MAHQSGARLLSYSNIDQRTSGHDHSVNPTMMIYLSDHDLARNIRSHELRFPSFAGEELAQVSRLRTVIRIDNNDRHMFELFFKRPATRSPCAAFCLRAFTVMRFSRGASSSQSRDPGYHATHTTIGGGKLTHVPLFPEPLLHPLRSSPPFKLRRHSCSRRPATHRSPMPPSRFLVSFDVVCRGRVTPLFAGWKVTGKSKKRSTSRSERVRSPPCQVT